MSQRHIVNMIVDESVKTTNQLTNLQVKGVCVQLVYNAIEIP